MPDRHEAQASTFMPYLIVVLLVFASLQLITDTASSQPDRGENPNMPTTVSTVSLATMTGRARLIVHSDSASVRAQVVSQGCEIIHVLRGGIAVNCPAGVSIPDSEPDRILHIMDTGADSQIMANQAWALGYTGSGATVAVLDTGVDFSHPELASSIAGGRSFVTYTTSYADDNGHGTHVAGIITSDGIVSPASKGVAYNAQVWMAKVCDAGGSCYDSDIATAIQYIVNNHIAKVMSISIGGGGTTAPNCDADFLASYVNWAYDNGVVAAIASGNDYSSTKVSSPACASKAIAVGAVTSSDSLASFSNRGSAMQDHGVVAPGVSIYSTYPGGGYAYMSGTSMATPHVSATMALMLGKNPGLTQATIRSTIFGSSSCLGGYTSCPNTYIGYGRINALNAVSMTPGGNTTVTSTATATSYLPRSTTTTVTSYTGTSTITSTVPAFTTVVLYPLTITEVLQSIQYLTSVLTSTVTSYTATETPTSTVVVPATVTESPSTVTVETIQSVTETGIAMASGYVTTTVTSYTGTETLTSTVPTVTTVVLVPQRVTTTVQGTQSLTSTSVTTVTSYSDTVTSTVTSLAYTTVTALANGGSSPLAYVAFLSLLSVGIGHKSIAGKSLVNRRKTVDDKLRGTG